MASWDDVARAAADQGQRAIGHNEQGLEAGQHPVQPPLLGGLGGGPLGLAAGLIVLVADQLSKWWVLNVLNLPELRQVVLLPVLNLTMVWNRGVTFGLLNGLGSWGHVLLAVIALAVVVALGFWLQRSETKVVAIAVGAIAGGGGLRCSKGRASGSARHGAAHVAGWVSALAALVVALLSILHVAIPVLATTLSTLLFARGEVRFRIPIDPYLLMLATFGGVVAIGWALQRLTSHRAGLDPVHEALGDKAIEIHV